MKSTTIKKQIVNPTTSKRTTRVFVYGKGWYVWNTVYHVYNRSTNYEQLKQGDLAAIVWSSPNTKIAGE